MKINAFSLTLVCFLAIICLTGCDSADVQPKSARVSDPNSLAAGDALGMQLFGPTANSTEISSVDAN